MANGNTKIHQHYYHSNLSAQWKSLPNLWFSQKPERTVKDKRMKFADRSDTLVPDSFYPPGCLERSKSVDFVGQCEVELNLFDEERELDFSTFDLYLSKDFTDVMNTSFSERSDLDSADANRDELEESLDAWTELQTSKLTRSNLTEALASRMYSYENLDRVGKSLYKINKWFQRCSFEENDTETTGKLKSPS